MKKIILTAAALLAISGSAFAGSGHYGSNGADQQAVVNVDKTPTASITNSGSPVYKLLNSSRDESKSAPQGADHNLFGNN